MRGVLLVVSVMVLYALWATTEVIRNAGVDDRDTTEAIVVLGAAQYDGTPSPVLQGRLDHALELFEAGTAPKVVLTGSKQPADRFTEAYAGFTYLLSRGVPEEAMEVVTDGASTYESLAATSRVLDEQAIDRVTLVSDGYHNRRMLGIASDVGLDATVSPSSTDTSLTRIGREAALVAAGEILGYRRLDRLS